MLAVATRSPQPSFHSSAHFDNVSVGGNASESIGTQNDICKNYYLITSVLRIIHDGWHDLGPMESMHYMDEARSEGILKCLIP